VGIRRDRRVDGPLPGLITGLGVDSRGPGVLAFYALEGVSRQVRGEEPLGAGEEQAASKRRGASEQEAGLTDTLRHRFGHTFEYQRCAACAASVGPDQIQVMEFDQVQVVRPHRKLCDDCAALPWTRVSSMFLGPL
jgi:hypothetical protein